MEEEAEVKIKITKKQAKELAKYPNLERCFYNLFTGEQDNDGEMSDLCLWIRVVCDDNDLDPTDELEWKYAEDFDIDEYYENPDAHPEWDWTTELAADFLSSGHNSAWQSVQDYLIDEDAKTLANLVIKLAKKYGDADISDYC